MRLMEILRTDEEILTLKEEYRRIFGRGCTYFIDQYKGIEDYKERMRKAIKEKNPITFDKE